MPFSDKLEDAGKILEAGIISLVGLVTLYSLADQTGLLDSMRTVEARRFANPLNTVKKIARVEEEWKDNRAYTPTFDGYNPKVIRTVTFEDGSQTILQYRMAAWQPFRRWLNGNEFNPLPEEHYEVASDNTIVKKIE